MKKEVIVLSLGGSMIIPKDINVKFLREFKKVLKKFSKKYRFVVVCGGGSTAREYIRGLKKEKVPNKRFHQGLLGIASTRLNARFMTYFFG
jgi:uridylate kinase